MYIHRFLCNHVKECGRSIFSHLETLSGKSKIHGRVCIEEGYLHIFAYVCIKYLRKDTQELINTYRGGESGLGDFIMYTMIPFEF